MDGVWLPYGADLLFVTTYRIKDPASGIKIKRESIASLVSPALTLKYFPLYFVLSFCFIQRLHSISTQIQLFRYNEANRLDYNRFLYQLVVCCATKSILITKPLNSFPLLWLRLILLCDYIMAGSNNVLLAHNITLRTYKCCNDSSVR